MMLLTFQLDLITALINLPQMSIAMRIKSLNLKDRVKTDLRKLIMSLISTLVVLMLHNHRRHYNKSNSSNNKYHNSSNKVRIYLIYWDQAKVSLRKFNKIQAKMLQISLMIQTLEPQLSLQHSNKSLNSNSKTMVAQITFQVLINHKPTLSKITSLKLTNLPQWLNLINQLLNSSNNNKITSLSLFQIWLVSTHSKCIQANRSFSCNNNNK